MFRSIPVIQYIWSVLQFALVYLVLVNLVMNDPLKADPYASIYAPLLTQCDGS